MARAWQLMIIKGVFIGDQKIYLVEQVSLLSLAYHRLTEIGWGHLLPSRR